MAYQSFLIILLIALVSGAPPQKIVGGSYGKLGEFPYLVSIRINGRHICGGAIISSRHILTAAHCVSTRMLPYNPPGVTVVTGTANLHEGGQTHQVQLAKRHPGFSQEPLLGIPHDVAVIALAEPMQFNNYQNKINLASKDFVDGSRAVIAGWGYTSSALKTVSDTVKKAYPRVIHCSLRDLVQICGKHNPGEDTCQGDSGSPLVLDNEVIGLVSSGPEICASGNSDVYTHVFKYRDYIQSQMNQF